MNAFKSHMNSNMKQAKSKISNILNIKHNIQITNTQSYPLKLNLKTKYFNKNILILGEGLHAMHPIAGQGFNLILRDIKKLQEILKYYSRIGISFKNSFALNDFYEQRKPENIIFSLGVDATHAFFKQNKYLDPFKEIILKNIGKNNVIKKQFNKLSKKTFVRYYSTYFFNTFVFPNIFK